MSFISALFMIAGILWVGAKFDLNSVAYWKLAILSGLLYIMGILSGYEFTQRQGDEDANNS